MSATNATTNYSLPLFIGTDKPAWLVDFNGAMTAIDAQMKTNATAIQANETSISGLSTTVSAHTTSINTISGEITTLSSGLNSAQGAINTIQSLIGNGEPTTTDKTLIGAINEIYGMITGGTNEITANNVGYTNTTSGLTATDVQAAIDEVVTMIPSGPGSVDADDVSYDNTSSGLSATNVQAAIDELVPAAWTSETLSVTLTKGTSDVDVKTLSETPNELKVFCSNGMVLHFDIADNPADRARDGIAISVTNSTYTANVYGDFVKSTGKIIMTYVGGSSAPASVSVDKIMYR